MKRLMRTEDMLLDKKEWDFSELADCSPEEKRAALDWELQREQQRTGQMSQRRRIVYKMLSQLCPAMWNPTANLPHPWLQLQKSLRRRQIAAYLKTNGAVSVREITHADALRFYRDYGGVPNGPQYGLKFHNYADNPIPINASVHVLAVDWSAEKADDTYDSIRKMAQSWRRQAMSPKRHCDDKPMAHLWDISCLRLREYEGIGHAAIRRRLIALHAFTTRRSPKSFNENEVVKSVTRAKLMLSQFCS